MSSLTEKIRSLPTWVLILIALITIVIILVPVVIIMSAVIGMFVLDIGDSSNIDQIPATQFDHDHHSSTNELTVTYVGGDEITGENITIRAGDTTHEWSSHGEIVPGDTTTIQNVSSGSTIVVMWDNGNTSAEISRYTVP